MCAHLQSCTPGFGFEMGHRRQSVEGEQDEGDMQEFREIENKTARSSVDELWGVWSEESCISSDSFQFQQAGQKDITSFSIVCNCKPTGTEECA